MLESKVKGHILPAIFLIVGAGIGIGFVQLAGTRSAGFANDFFLTLLGMIFAMGSGLLWAEAILAAKQHAHIPTISRIFLGKFGIFLSYFSFLFVTTNYLLDNFGISFSFIYGLLLNKFQIAAPPLLVWAFLFLLFATILFFGLQVANKVNFILVTSFIFTFSVVFFLDIDFFSIQNLQKGEWFYLIFMAPVLTTAYTYQFIIPTYCHYLNNDAKKIRNGIVIALVFMFILIMVWQIFLIKKIPNEYLLATFEHKMPTFHGLQLLARLKNRYSWLYISFIFTMFTTIITTALALLDFLLDFFSISQKQISSRAVLSTTILLPTTLFASFYLPSYMVIAHTVISWFELIVVGILPSWIVLKIRYQKKLSTPQLLPGGRAVLLIFFFIALLHCYFQGANLIWNQ